MHLIDIIDKQDLNGYFYYNIEMMQDFIKKGNKVTLIYETKNIKILVAEEQKIRTAGINLFEYNNHAELISFLKSNSLPIYINTFYEKHILLRNNLQKQIGQPTTSNPNIFMDKSLQKENNTHVVIKNNEKPNKNNFSLDFPVFVKPIKGTASIGVAKVNNFQELEQHIKNINKSFTKLKQDGLETHDLIIEEFIVGQQYAMSYFVDQNGTPHINKAQKLRDNLGGKDTFLICGETSQQAHEEINEVNFLKFIKKTIKNKQIKNTFIGHQFKITPQGEYKTIELNGRVLGFHVEANKLSYDKNFLDVLINLNEAKSKETSSSAVIKRYPKTEQSFIGYNQEFLQKIKELKSNHRGYIFPQTVGNKIGTPKDGYFYYGVLILHNSDREQFVKDFQWVRDNYYGLFL